MLQQVFTCNIDGLDHQTSVPNDKIVAVHGTLSRARCEFCRHEMPSDTFRELVRASIKDISASDPSAPAESSAIKCPQCDRAGMKPSTVLYDADLDARARVIDAGDGFRQAGIVGVGQQQRARHDRHSITMRGAVRALVPCVTDAQTCAAMRL